MRYIALSLFLLIVIIISIYVYKKIYVYFYEIYQKFNKAYEGFNNISTNNTNNTKNIVLLGDSIFNNSTYSSNGKGVDNLIIEKTRGTNNKLYSYAEDYSKIVDIYSQINSIPSYLNSPNTTIFISSGGNDLLTYYDDKGNNISDISVLTPMFTAYKKVLKNIKTRLPKCKIVLLDIYYPDNMHFKKYHPVIEEWNKNIYSYANDHKNGIHSVLKISNMLTDKSDFSFGIEPSSSGGEKIATGIMNYY